jgi:hypothetical protein
MKETISPYYIRYTNNTYCQMTNVHVGYILLSIHFTGLLLKKIFRNLARSIMSAVHNTSDDKIYYALFLLKVVEQRYVSFIRKINFNN